MTRALATTPKRRRRREGSGVLAAVALAAAAGLVAGHFGTHRAWENPATASTSTSVPFVDPQRTP